MEGIMLYLEEKFVKMVRISDQMEQIFNMVELEIA
jgi:hypothetical protein